MDVLIEIKKEHDEFRSTIAAIEKAKGQKKLELFNEFYAKLHGHHEAEERVLFPDVKKMAKKKDKEVVLEMIEEHNIGTYQFSLISRTGMDNETWDAKFSVLKEVLTHHMDEEEKEFFKLAREVLDEEVLAAKYEPFEETMTKYMEEQKKKLNS